MLSSKRTLFTGGMVFDGTGAAPAAADVVIEGSRIVDVGTGLDGDQAVDCTGQTIVPGLFDCHVHVTVSHLDLLARLQAPFSLQFYEAARNLRNTIAVGITTVRDAGGADLGIRTAQELGLIAGPRMRIAISIISQTGGHGDDWAAGGCEIPFFLPHPGRPAAVVDGPGEMRRKVRELVRAGADVIKVATSGGVLSERDDPEHAHFRDDEIAVLAAEAAAAGLDAMSHAGSAAGIKTALRNGVRSIEHGNWIDDEGIDLMLRRGAWLVPTLMAARGVVAAADAGLALGDHIVEKARRVAEAQSDSVRRAIAAGVQVAMGTDSGVTPHGQNLTELALLVEHGMTPLAALHSATLSAARLLRMDSALGSLERGKVADLVIIDGDGLKFESLDRRVAAVYQCGQLVCTPNREVA